MAVKNRVTPGKKEATATATESKAVPRRTDELNRSHENTTSPAMAVRNVPPMWSPTAAANPVANTVNMSSNPSAEEMVATPKHTGRRAIRLVETSMNLASKSIYLPPFSTI